MKISSNIIADMTVSNMNLANKRAGKAMQRLSSGLKINLAGDDPSGMAIANKLSTQVKLLEQANTNAMDGISMVQTAEGALNEIHSMLNRMRELCVQSENGTLQPEDKEKIQEEVSALYKEIETIGKNTQFNKKSLLNTDEKMPIQIGTKSSHKINGGTTQLIDSTQILEIDGTKINVEKQILATLDNIVGGGFLVDGKDLLKHIDDAVAKTSSIRGYLGAIQNRLEHTVANIDVSSESTITSLSRIQDADMAEEMTNYTQFNVISQAGISMLAQANQRPQQVLQLLNS